MLDFLTANDSPGEYPATFYASSTSLLEKFPEASGEIICDVCVIGAGFTGLSAALHMAERGYNTVLIDANRIGWGASGRNGGQLGIGQRVEQRRLEKMLGRYRARMLWDISLESVRLVHDLCERHQIDCDYRPGIIHADHRQRYVKHSHEEVNHLNTVYGYDKVRSIGFDEIRSLIGSKDYFGGSIDTGSGHLNPLKLALGLARAAKAAGVRIFEQTRVSEIIEANPAVVVCPNAQVKARYVTICCNGYIGNLHKAIASRVMPINNFIVATEVLSEEVASGLLSLDHAVADSRFVINYFRLSPERRLLFGGGETYGYRFPRDVGAPARRAMLGVFPQLRETKIDFAWGGTLAITRNRLPYLKRLRGNILTACGYSGHGVGMATFAGKTMADVIEGQSGKFDIMAAVGPSSFPGGALLRWPLLVMAMLVSSMRDKI